MTIKGELVDASEVLEGDWIILPTIGAHFVAEVETYDEETGTDPGPRVRIIYRAPMTLTTLGTKPYKPGDRVAITRRDA